MEGSPLGFATLFCLLSMMYGAFGTAGEKRNAVPDFSIKDVDEALENAKDTWLPAQEKVLRDLFPALRSEAVRTSFADIFDDDTEQEGFFSEARESLLDTVFSIVVGAFLSILCIVGCAVCCFYSYKYWSKQKGKK